jgi:hypothetical protein
MRRTLSVKKSVSTVEKPYSLGNDKQAVDGRLRDNEFDNDALS